MPQSPDVRMITESALATFRDDLKEDYTFTDRGVLPDGADLNNYRGPEFAGAWYMPQTSTYLNAGERSGQSEVLYIMNTNDATVQTVYGYNTLRYREAPGSSWGLWRKIADEKRISSAVERPITSDITSLDDLGPGKWKIQYFADAQRLGLPNRLGTVTVTEITENVENPVRFQKFETDRGSINYPDGTVEPYEVWVRGMNYDRTYEESFTKVLSEGNRMTLRGDVPNGADLNDYAGPEHVGAWRMPAASTYLNAGERSGQSEMLYVMHSGISRVQTVYGYNTLRYRQAPGSSWGLWRYIAEKTRVASKVAIGPTHSAHITSLTAPGVKAFDKDGATPDRPLSTTKMFTLFVARTVITDALLDALVTVSADDVDPGGSGDVSYQVGDKVSYRDLFYAMMLSSSNWSAELVARAVGDQMPGDGTGRDKFLDAMRSYADTWGWEGYAISTPSGLGTVNRFSTDQLADLALRMAPDAWACSVTRARTWTVNISGPNPRTVTTTHAFDWEGPIDFSDVVALKGGSGGGYYNLIVLWRTRTGEYCSTALIGSNTEQRNQDLRYVMNLTAAELDRQYIVTN